MSKSVPWKQKLTVMSLRKYLSVMKAINRICVYKCYNRTMIKRSSCFVRQRLESINYIAIWKVKLSLRKF